MTDSGLTCTNCGHPAGRQLCGHCGQALHDRRSPLAWIVRELAEEWFSIDGRIVRTLRALIHPGALTKHHLDGKRVTYLAPFRLYVIASLALFSSLLALRAPDARAINFYIAGDLVSGDASQNRGTVRIVEPDSLTARWVLTRSTTSLPSSNVVHRRRC